MFATLMLVLAVAGPECLERMAAHPVGVRPTFTTELECEEWEAIVQLEGEVRTATQTVAILQGAIKALVERPVVVKVPERVVETVEEPRPLWRKLASIGSAGAGGALGGWVGLAIEQDAGARQVVAVGGGAAIGAVIGVLIAESL